MEVLYLLIPIAIILVGLLIGILIWAVKNDQFEDLDRHGHDILMDDDSPGDKDKNN